jgi:TolB-like protein/DNA-binding winged helix-turn-helix (wHTH) protein/Tfp pilus assembly protein PilF
MDALVTVNVFLFEAFRFDRRAGGLFRRDDGGALVPVAIGSRALAVLGILIARQGDLISKEEIMQTVWPETVVEDNNLTVQISALRRVLDQGRAKGSCIQTIAGRGYRFVAAVTRRQETDSDPGAGPILRGGDSGATGDRRSPAATASVTIDGESDAPMRKRRRLWRAAVVMPIVLALAGLAVAWDYRWFDSGGPRRLSIVVLPFANLSDDREQQYFADGVTEDLTTDLSRISDSFVISRNTAFTYKDKPVNAKQIGRELGVRYVLEGSVQRSGKQVRVNAQLIDAETDGHLWAERFERDIGDLFALQNEITSRIAIALNFALVGAEAARPTANPDALDYMLRGLAAGLKPPSRDKYAESISLFERALALDPQSVEAQSRLAQNLAARVLDQMTDTEAADIARAEGLAGQAMAASPQSPLAHMAKGQVLRAQHRFAEAIPEYETALASNRNAAWMLHALGMCKLYAGSIEETIPLEEQAIRLSPRDPQLGNWYAQIGGVHLLQSRTDEAIVWFEKSRNFNPAKPNTHANLAAAYALNGESDRAAAELAEARRVAADDRYTSIARLRAVAPLGESPKIRALFEATYLAGLRKAGMPEE